MNKGVIWGVIIVVILVIAGLLTWRSAGPNGEPMPTNLDLLPTFSPITSVPAFTTSAAPEGSPTP